MTLRCFIRKEARVSAVREFAILHLYCMSIQTRKGECPSVETYFELYWFIHVRSAG